MYQRQTAADTARAKAAAEAANKAAEFGYKVKEKGVDAKIDAAKDSRKHGYTMEEKGADHAFDVQLSDRKAADVSDLEDKKSTNRMTEDANKAQVEAANIPVKEKAKVQAKIDALKSAGYDDEAIRGMMPMLMNAESYKKPTSPGEARRMAFDARMKGDFSFAGKSAAEQNRIIDGDISIINGTGVSPSAPAKRGTAPNPAASGIGDKPAAPSKAVGKGVPVYDSKTGTIVYR